MKVREGYFVLGAACAVIAGSLVAFIDGFGDLPGLMLSDPRFVGLGMTVAAAGGGVLARRVVNVPRVNALGIAILLGVAVPMVSGAIVTLPLAPIGALFGFVVWPVTIPAALIWMVAVRSFTRDPSGRDRALRVNVALGLAVILLAVRYTQPAWVDSSGGTRCLRFPGEEIGSIAWSPDGVWLGIGSSRDGMGLVRLLHRPTGRITELAGGPGIDADGAGVAVGPDGTTAYLDAPVEAGGEPGMTESDASIMVAAPGAPPRLYARLPGPAIRDLTYTDDGIAGVLWFDPETDEVDVDKLVWIDEGATPEDHLPEITSAEAIRLPILAPLVRPNDAFLSIATPSGPHGVRRPDVYGRFSVTRDGREVVFIEVAPDQDERHDEVVVLSTETGARQVLALAELADDPHVAGGWLAYRTVLTSPNSVCMTAVE